MEQIWLLYDGLSCVSSDHQGAISKLSISTSELLLISTYFSLLFRWPPRFSSNPTFSDCAQKPPRSPVPICPHPLRIKISKSQNPLPQVSESEPLSPKLPINPPKTIKHEQCKIISKVSDGLVDIRASKHHKPNPDPTQQNAKVSQN